MIFDPCGLNSDGKKWWGGSNSDFWGKYIALDKLATLAITVEWLTNRLDTIKRVLKLDSRGIYLSQKSEFEPPHHFFHLN